MTNEVFQRHSSLCRSTRLRSQVAPLRCLLSSTVAKVGKILIRDTSRFDFLRLCARTAKKKRGQRLALDRKLS